MKNFVLASLLFCSFAAQSALITADNVTATGTVNNAPSLIIDQNWPAEASVWNANSNVWWRGTTPKLTIDLGGLYRIDDVVLSIDNNDDYLVEWSLDGSSWQRLFSIARTDGEIWWGMDTLSSESGNAEYVANIDFTSVNASYLRISAVGGDNMYSVGEVLTKGIAVGPVNQVPNPSALLLITLGLMALRLSRK